MRRAGKGPGLVAEDLAFDQVARDGGAVDRDERPCRARAALVKQVGDNLLAAARRAGDQDRRIRRREPVDAVTHRGDGCADADQRGEAG